MPTAEWLVAFRAPRPSAGGVADVLAGDVIHGDGFGSIFRCCSGLASPAIHQSVVDRGISVLAASISGALVVCRRSALGGQGGERSAARRRRRRGCPPTVRFVAGPRSLGSSGRRRARARPRSRAAQAGRRSKREGAPAPRGGRVGSGGLVYSSGASCHPPASDRTGPDGRADGAGAHCLQAIQPGR